MIENYYPDHIL